jgi:glycine cleavage system H lipoate-binding protein
MGPAGTDVVHNAEFSIPGGVLVSSGHCWASIEDDGTVKIGLDDFARKLLGNIDSIELPEIGMDVNAGQPLFSVAQGQRRAPFHAPVSGKVLKVNDGLAGKADAIEEQPYGGNWICVIDGKNLDTELPGLKIGKSAVIFFQEEIDRFQAFLQGTDFPDSGLLYTGAFEKLSDGDWESAVGQFFAH